MLGVKAKPHRGLQSLLGDGVAKIKLKTTLLLLFGVIFLLGYDAKTDTFSFPSSSSSDDSNLRPTSGSDPVIAAPPKQPPPPPRVEYLGSQYGGWACDTSRISSSSVIYSVGLGEDISWDLAMIEKFQVQIHGFDPTPKSADFIQGQVTAIPRPMQKFLYTKEGLAKEAGSMVFTKPKDKDHVSMRLGSHDGLGEQVTVPVSSLKDWMTKFHHQHLDILKIDIEGAEYDVLEQLIADDYLPFTQLLVEWHNRFFADGGKRHQNLMNQLQAKGFKVFDSRNGGQETAMIRE